MSHIRKVTLSDLEDLLKISRQTFIETFAGDNTEQNLRKYLDENMTSDKLRNELANPDSEFYFATVGDKAIGYLKLNHGSAQTEEKDSKSLEIERIYVLKEFLGKQVGQVLFEMAYRIAKDAKYNRLWLGVWERNSRAIRFYRKNGFVEFGTHAFRLGDDEQTDILMKIELAD
ncbi:MAG TPA: GNAT family N-acetyltransferase [Bacteroidia bacterium]|jgi:ribosomal protein S18 acetylase RimI-like enzyme|nr:GNAT family N-acetyltransferase [Bacteroidia bacterium]